MSGLRRTYNLPLADILQGRPIKLKNPRPGGEVAVVKLGGADLKRDESSEARFLSPRKESTFSHKFLLQSRREHNTARRE